MALGAGVLVVAMVVHAPIAEDWDGLGFVSSVTTYDLAAFSPHPPGYPVYVLMLRAAAFLVGDAALGGALVSAVSAAICAYCTFQMLAPRVGRSPALAGATAGALGSLVLRSSSQVGTEALGLAFLLLSLAFAHDEPAETADRGPDRGADLRTAQWVGLTCGLGLGVRLSWWPLYLGMVALVAGRVRVRALASMAFGVLLWAVPLALLVGPRKLFVLLTTHSQGHAERFGHTLLHDGDVMGHLAALARDLTADGLGIDTTVLGLAIAVVAAASFARFVSLWANGVLRPRTAIALALLAYGIFVLLFQNVIESPRHVVPIVYAGCVAAGVGVATPWRRLPAGVARRRGPLALATLLVLLLGARGAKDGLDRRVTPPLGAQVVALVRGDLSYNANDAAIFGGESARFAIAAGVPGGYAENLADVALAEGAMQHLPKVTYVTNEISFGGPNVELPRGRKLCRPERLDRKHACLWVYVSRG